MVADGEIAVSQPLRQVGEAGESDMAITPIGMDVEVAADISIADDLREPSLEGQLDLAPVLPHLGGKEGEAQGGVDFFLSPSGNFLGPPEDSVLGYLQPLVFGHSPELDAVGLGAGEVLEGGPELGIVDDPEVDLPLSGFRGDDDRTLGCALRQNPGRFRMGSEKAGDGGAVTAAGQDVDISDRLLHPAQRPGCRDALDPGGILEVGEDFVGQSESDIDRHSLLRFLVALNPLEDVAHPFVAHPRECGQGAVPDDLL